MTDPTLPPDPETLDRLAAADPAAWQPLFEALIAAPGAAPPAVAAAWLARDPLPTWLERAKQAAARIDSPRFTTIGAALRPFRAWIEAGAAAVLPAGSPAALRLGFDRLRQQTGPEALAETRALAEQVAGLGLPWAAEVWLLLSRRASEEGDHPGALAAAEAAGEGDLAARARGAALLRLRRVGEALATLAPAMRRPGPLFGGGGSFAFTPIADPLDAALDELATVAGWATSTTPEWVGGLGGAWAAGGGPELEEAFEAALQALAAGPGAREDLEVVARQAGERGAEAVRARALRRLAAIDPEAGFAADVAEARAAADPDRLWALFGVARADDRRLVETEAGLALADALLDHCLDAGDPRALEVAEALVDAKTRLWGPDAPSTWLERQNLGTVLARLGRAEEARAALAAAVQGLARLLGEGHPRVQMARRNLARLG